MCPYRLMHFKRCFVTLRIMNFIAVCAYSGWRQTAACSEVGRQRDQVRAGDQGWEDGHGECAEFLASDWLDSALHPTAKSPIFTRQLLVQ